MNFWQDLIAEENLLWAKLPFLLAVLFLGSVLIYFIWKIKWEDDSQDKGVIGLIKQPQFFFSIFVLLFVYSVADMLLTNVVFHCDDSTLVTFPQSFYEDKRSNQPEPWQTTPEADRSRQEIQIGKCDYITAGNRVWGFLGGVSFVFAATTYFYTVVKDQRDGKENKEREDRKYALDYEPHIEVLAIQTLREAIDMCKIEYQFKYNIIQKNKNFQQIVYPISNNLGNPFLSIVNIKGDAAKHVRLYITTNLPERKVDVNNLGEKVIIENIDFSQGNLISELQDNKTLRDIDSLNKNSYYIFWKGNGYLEKDKKGKLKNDLLDLDKITKFYILLTYRDRHYKNVYIKSFVANVKDTFKDKEKIIVKNGKPVNFTNQEILNVKLDSDHKSQEVIGTLKYLEINKLSINQVTAGERKIFEERDKETKDFIEYEIHNIILPKIFEGKHREKYRVTRDNIRT